MKSVESNGLVFQLKKYRKEQKTGITSKDIAKSPEAAAIAVWFD